MDARQVGEETAERFRRLAANAPDVFYNYDLVPQPRLRYVNPAAERVTGFSEADLRDLPNPRALVHPDDLALAVRAFRGLRVPQPLLLRLLHRDGHVVWTEHYLVAVRDGEGRVVEIDGIAHDITRRRSLEEQLAQAQRLEMAGRVASQVAHDLNNLLMPLATYPRLIKSRLGADHPAVVLCDAMLESANQIVDITEDLMALGRRCRLERQPVDLNRLVDQVIEELLDRPEGVRILRELQLDLLPVAGSPVQLLRVVNNLLTNACEACEAARGAGTVLLRTRNVSVDASAGSDVRAGEYVRLDVIDSGTGIPRDIRDRIFDPFFTTKTSVKRHGSGLGLSIVYTVVADHNGYLHVESEVGKGTIFTVYLPTLGGASGRPAGDEAPGGSETILVVDDDPLQREVLGNVLKHLGYQVTVIGSGEAVQGRLRAEPIDLLILDMVMPGGLGGLETYRQAVMAHPGQKAILLSGFAQSEEVIEAQSLGAGAFVQKPVSPHRLARIIRDELDRRG